MKRRYNKIIEYVTFSILVIALLLIIFLSGLFTYKKIEIATISNCLICIGILLLIVYILSKVHNFTFNKFEVLIFILMGLSLLSVFGALNVHQALFGQTDRKEGLFVIYTYYLFALNTHNIKENKLKTILLYVILFIGFSNIAYGLLQTGIINISLPIKNSWKFARGFNGNSMFYGSLLSICYPLTIGFFIKSEKKHEYIIYSILMVIFCFGLLNSGSMAAFVGSIATIVFLLIKSILISIRSKKFSSSLVKVLIIILVFVANTFVIRNMNHYFKKDLKDFYKETQSVSTLKVDDSFGTGRIHIWKSTLPTIKKHLVFGVGIDNFQNALVRLRDIKTGAPVDKAHNEYLQKIVCEGIISGIFYLVFLFLVFINNVKKDDKIVLIAFLAFISYSVQAFFGISVTRVSPIYFVIIGLLIDSSNVIGIDKKSAKKVIDIHG